MISLKQKAARLQVQIESIFSRGIVNTFLVEDRLVLGWRLKCMDSFLSETQTVCKESLGKNKLNLFSVEVIAYLKSCKCGHQNSRSFCFCNVTHFKMPQLLNECIRTVHFVWAINIKFTWLDQPSEVPPHIDRHWMRKEKEDAPKKKIQQQKSKIRQ